MNERRTVTRTRVRRNAEIVVSGRGTIKLQCTLQNLTSGGACLSVAGTDRVPDTFDLTFDRGRSHRSCWVRWRTGDQLGISFEKPAD